MKKAWIKNVKRTAALMLALAMVFSCLAGCGKKEAAAEEETTIQEELSDEEAWDDEETWDEAQAGDDEEAWDNEYDDGPYAEYAEAVAELLEIDTEHDDDTYYDFNSNKSVDKKTALKDMMSFFEDRDADSTFIGMNQQAFPDREEVLPEKFDLRDKGLVTPVKNQKPWSSCWAFGVIAACESSILSSLGKTYKDTELDLSEKHILNFSGTYLPEDSEQSGEGVHYREGKNPYENGNFGMTGLVEMSAGRGPVLESSCPYVNSAGKADKSGDWSVDPSMEFESEYQLQDGNVLSNVAVRDDSNYLWNYDEYAVECIKEELLKGRGVTVSYNSSYINDNWCSYCEEMDSASHTVCIVGWDDTYPAEKCACKDKDGDMYTPEYDGVWICKNSWGAETEDAQSGSNFGIRDKDGKATGYFYLSYYDWSATDFTSFNFDVNNTFNIQQYDYFQSCNLESWTGKDVMASANVYVAEEDTSLCEVSFTTADHGTNVTYFVYLLDNDAEHPTDGELVSVAVADYKYAGFHRMDLNEPVELSSGQLYSIVAVAMVDKGDEDNPEYLVTSLTGKNETMYIENDATYVCSFDKAVVNRGESFIYSGKYKRWMDFAEVLEDRETYYYDWDNFPIKAYTR